MDRITITLPNGLVSQVDRETRNRSRFVQEAIEHELELRQRRRLLESVASTHQESEAVSDDGTAAWVAEAGPLDSSLLDPADGTPVRWTPESGWRER